MPIVFWEKRFTGTKIFTILSNTFLKSQKTCEFEVYTQSKKEENNEQPRYENLL